MLIAAALDSEWLLPGGRNGLAFHGIDELLITSNCLDPVLRLYPRMRAAIGPSALGFAGPACPRRLSDAGLRFESVRVECQVGARARLVRLPRQSGRRFALSAVCVSG